MHGQRQSFHIMFKSGQPFCFAGLWERWLYDNDPRSEIFTWALEHPSEDPLKIYPVSPMINNAKVDDPLCVQPYRIS